MFKDDFPLDSKLIYLNHAAVAPWPKCTAQAVDDFAKENLHWGATGYPEWMTVESSLRDRLAWLINAPSSDDISLLKNTSEALSTIAYGLRWKQGDNVVTFRQEFPSNRVVWQSLEQFGVEIRLIDIQEGISPEETLLSACDSNTRLISTSSVQYASGLRINLDKIGDYCQKRDVLFCVDAIQSLGALPFDVQVCQADFVVADGHKWMLGPEGLALLYVRESLRESLDLNQFGWHMLRSQGDFDNLEWEASKTGTRFECGSPNMLGIHALNASLGFIREVGIQTIASRVLDNTRYLMDKINQTKNLTLLSPADEARRSGIVTFQVANSDQSEIYHQLMQEKVICAARGGGIRFSPHFYTGKDKLDGALEILSKITTG